LWPRLYPGFNACLIERHFAVSADTAKQFMDRLVAEKRFGNLQPDGWHYPPIRKLRQRRSPAKPKTISERQIEPQTPEDLTLRIDELGRERDALRTRVKKLQESGKTVIAQREDWKARALAAEKRMEADRDLRSRRDDRFDALRRLVAKELHPDFCNGSELEKLIRAEFFKKLWPEIERLAERG
jgi:hypothetical protein